MKGKKPLIGLGILLALFFLLQILCFLAVAVMTRRLNVAGFRSTVQSRFASMAEALD